MSDLAEMGLDENNQSMQMSFVDTERSITLDGSSSAALSDVLSATSYVAVRIVPQDFGACWVVRGETPTTAATDTGMYVNGATHMIVDKDEKLSVYGAKVNVCILRREQA